MKQLPKCNTENENLILRLFMNQAKFVNFNFSLNVYLSGNLSNCLPFSEHNDCTECGQNFRGKHSKRDLANHMKTHQKVETFCHFCKKDYKTKKGLNKHKKMSCPEHLHT